MTGVRCMLTMSTTTQRLRAETAHLPKKAPERPSAVFAYVHHNRRVGALVTIKCDTDFALRTDVLEKFGHDLARQLAAMGSTFSVLDKWLTDESKTIGDVLTEVRQALGEAVEVGQVHVQ